ncbi:MAG: glycine cleavage system protein H [Zavarzinella sp.]
MADELTFMMGKYAAVLPSGFRYCKNHMWCRTLESGIHRFGFSSYAIRLMQDVYFLEWSIDADTPVVLKQQIGNIETSKATSDLYVPIAGQLVAFNQAVLADPSLINISGYDQGWLFDIAGDITPTLSLEEYFAFLDGAWELTQRHIKKQMHEE